MIKTLTRPSESLRPGTQLKEIKLMEILFDSLKIAMPLKLVITLLREELTEPCLKSLSMTLLISELSISVGNPTGLTKQSWRPQP